MNCGSGWSDLKTGKRDKLTEYLLFSFAVVLIYTAIEFVVSTLTGVSHDTLTTCIYAFFGTEIGACAFIKISKRKQKDGGQEWDDTEVSTDDEGAEG